MGTHPKAPSMIDHPPEVKGILLGEWLRGNQWSLGDKVSNEFNGNLPFLFKVLSINKALSIQAHPTKDHALTLHAHSPHHYPDPNHKPELVIVINRFEGMCGFRPFNEIQSFVTIIPELKTVLGPDVTELIMKGDSNGDGKDLKDVLSVAFTALMKQDDGVVKNELDKLCRRLQENNPSGLSPGVVQLFLRLHGWFPGDVGCWCCFFLNHIVLNEGQSLYLAPNEPHAYIGGDVIECMACSDNVVRAGLTPKFKDKNTLCTMLTYNMRSSDENIFHSKPHPQLEDAHIYDPPTPEFAVARIRCHGDTLVPPVNGPSVFLVYEGSGSVRCGDDSTLAYVKGNVFFVPAGNPVQFKPTDNTMLFQAYCQL
jgi:mannose-6-phosphate isomerase